MMCGTPIALGVRLFPCGQCTPCRINRRRIWTHRLMLEASQHDSSSFVTLTYSDKELPYGGSLQVQDFTDWLKRYRRAIEPRRIRFYGVGEYGEERGRPHYHIGIFGGDVCEHGVTRHWLSRCCGVCSQILETWGKGAIECESLSRGLAQYLCGYMVKRMTRYDDPRLEGRFPEFCRMSNRPGLGYDFLHDVADKLLEHNLDKTHDVPVSLMHGGKSMPLGPYLRRKLREMIGHELNTPKEVIDAQQREMHQLPGVSEVISSRLPGEAKGAALRSAVISFHKGRVASVEARDKLRKQRRRL